MEKTYFIGEYEVTLTAPSEAVYDAYVDAARRGGANILLTNCVLSPDRECISRMIAAKPALKRRLVQLIEDLAGTSLPSMELEPDPAHPGCRVHAIGDYRVVWRPATEAQYDQLEAGAATSISAAVITLVQACVVSPPPGELTEICARIPALKHHVARLIVEEAGGLLEVREKK